MEKILIVAGCMFLLAGGLYKAYMTNDWWFALASLCLFVANGVLWLR